MISTKKFLYYVTILLLLPSGVNSKDIFDFALSLYQEQDYYRSISELKRFLYHFPDEKRADEARLYVARNYFLAGQYGQGIRETANLKNSVKQNYFRDQLDLFLARDHMFLDDLPAAKSILRQVEKDTSFEELREEARFQFIWTDILARRWKEAREQVIRFSEQYPKTGYKEKSISLKDELEKAADFTYLSPGLAGLFSALLPGLGQVYCKRTGDGLVAFTMIALLSYGVYYYHENGPDGMFYGFAILDGIFYLGNIYTAVGSSLKYNRNMDNDFKLNLVNMYY
ncbi:MAG: hypothetical protein PHF84_04070 [bacterium]|nr:hypothetical protein [bacterium]